MLSMLRQVLSASWALVSLPQQPASSLLKAHFLKTFLGRTARGRRRADEGDGDEVAVPTSLSAALSSVSQAQTQDLEEVAQGPLAWCRPPSLSFLRLTFQPLRWSRYTGSAEAQAGAHVFEQRVPERK